MRTAHRQARSVLGVRPTPDGHEAWGWRGRTLSQPVTAPGGPAWLRLACSPTGQIDRTFWDGSLAAEKTIPASVPRPRLREIHDFNHQAWEYRAELYDRITARPIAPSPTLTAAPDLPSSWWTALRTALGDITTISTDRHTTEQQYLDWAMPKFLGTSLDTRTPAWSTAHGDLHWANLCAPRLTVFDWEGWGLAPTGYDPAMLPATASSYPTWQRASAASSRRCSTPRPAATPNSSPSPNSCTPSPVATTFRSPNRSASVRHISWNVWSSKHGGGPGPWARDAQRAARCLSSAGHPRSQ